MTPQTPAEAVVELFNSMNKGQYLLVTAAIQRMGGVMDLDWDEFSLQAGLPLVPVHVEDLGESLRIHVGTRDPEAPA